MLNELEQPIWAVATAREVLGSYITYAEAVKLTEDHIDKPGICIITAKAADQQIKLKEKRNGLNTKGT